MPVQSEIFATKFLDVSPRALWFLVTKGEPAANSTRPFDRTRRNVLGARCVPGTFEDAVYFLIKGFSCRQWDTVDTMRMVYRVWGTERADVASYINRGIKMSLRLREKNGTKRGKSLDFIVSSEKILYNRRIVCQIISIFTIMINKITSTNNKISV